MTVNDLIRRLFPGSYCHVAESGGTLFVQHLIVSDAAKTKGMLGTGYKIARLICDYADRKEYPIVINAERVENFETDEEKLQGMYSRLGFRDYKNAGIRGMIRYPLGKGDPIHGETNTTDGISGGSGEIGLSSELDDEGSGYSGGPSAA